MELTIKKTLKKQLDDRGIKLIPRSSIVIVENVIPKTEAVYLGFNDNNHQFIDVDDQLHLVSEELNTTSLIYKREVGRS